MDSNVNVLIFVESRYKVNRKRIQKAVRTLLTDQGITSPVEVSIGIVGNRKMRKLHKQYIGEDKTTNVLSFPLGEGESTYLPNDVLRLGDVILAYPVLIDEAAEDDMLVDDKVEELIKHGVLHLLGEHHE